MKILIYTDNYFPEENAAASRVSERAKLLVKFGHEVTVVTSFPNFPTGKPYKGYKDGWFKKELIDGVKLLRIKTFMSPNKGRIRRALDFLSYAVSAGVCTFFLEKPDMIICSSPHLLVPTPAIIARQIFDVPLITEIADLWPDSIYSVDAMQKGPILNRLFSSLESIIYERSNAIVGVTKSISSVIQSRVTSPEKVHTVYNGIDDAEAVDSEESNFTKEDIFGSSDVFVFGYFGTIGLAHNVEGLVKSFHKIKNPDLRLLIIGNGAKRDTVEALHARISDPRILILESVSKILLQKYYNIIDVGIAHLKDQQTFKTVLPTKILEYVAFDTPVLLVCPNGEATNFVDKNDIGYSASPGNQDQFAFAIDALLEDKRKGRLREKQFANIKQNYTRTSQTLLWNELILNIA